MGTPPPLRHGWKLPGDHEHVLLDVGTEWWLLQRRRDRLLPATAASVAVTVFGAGVDPVATYVTPLVLRVPVVGPATYCGQAPPPIVRCHAMFRREVIVQGVTVEFRLDAFTKRGVVWFADVCLTPHQHPDGAARKALFTSDVRHLMCATTTAMAADFIARILDELASFLADLAVDGFAPQARSLKLPPLAEALWFTSVGDVAWDVSLPTVGDDYTYVAVPAPTPVRPYTNQLERSLALQRLATQAPAWWT